jgi:hypothetical protein
MKHLTEIDLEGGHTKKLLKYTKNQGLMTSRAVSDDKEIIEKQKNENKRRKISETVREKHKF